MAKQRCRGHFYPFPRWICFAEGAGLIFGAAEPAEGWSMGARALPATVRTHPQPGWWGQHCKPLHLFFMSGFFLVSKH